MGQRRLVTALLLLIVFAAGSLAVARAATPRQRLAPPHLPQERTPPALPVAKQAEGERGDRGDEIAALDRELARETSALERERATRDRLLVRLERTAEATTGLGRLRAAWERRRLRSDLEEVVGRLHRRQALLLQLRARREAALTAAADQEWDELERLLGEAEAAWRQGRPGEPFVEQAIARALEAARPVDGGYAIERYRALVERLARVNGVIRRLSVIEEEPAVREEQTVGPTHAGSEDAGFLGVTERGAVLAASPEAALEGWMRLRAGLAREIVTVASEITRRAQSPS